MKLRDYEKNYDVVIRNDDVLQAELWSKQSRKYLKSWRPDTGKTEFELFLDGDKPFAKYNYPCILSVIADGIDKYPDWVDYIKQNMDRYVIELHGSSHFYYSDLTEKAGERELRLGKEKIEDTFGIKISTWFITFGRSKAPDWGERVCKKLGIKYDYPRTKRDADLWLINHYKKGIYPFFHINFHYWHPEQRKDIAEVLKIINEGH